MSFEWRDYFTLAETLLSSELRGGREACLRSAMSRAYYAAFATARRQSRERHGGIVRQSAAEHGEVATFYASRGDAGGAIAAHLTRLRFLRNRADYDDELAGPDEAADEAIARAREVLQLLEAL
ncbi:MAG: hypothetical protein ACRD3J_14110 [Thermoanaerobaculia bacterium]